MADNREAVLLLAFGGPESLDDVGPFLQNISGRRLSSEQTEEIVERYKLIGGKSPLREITERQAGALQKKLDDQKKPYEVFIGMRYWHPYIKETLDEITGKGITDIKAIIMAPQKSEFSENGYQKALDTAIKELELDCNIKLVSEWYSNKNFVHGMAERIKKGISSFEDEDTTLVLFTAHSLPLKFISPADRYVTQIQKTIEAILEITGELNWKMGFQSKGMIPGDWLEPTVDSILKSLTWEGYKGVLFVPICFVSDHVETLYDIDIVYRDKVESQGLQFSRAESLNDSPELIEALADLV